MQRESNWRLYFTLFITLICLALIYPTVRYIHCVFSPPVKTAYSTDQDYDKAFAEYDEKKQGLQRNAIKLGLDLVGGVDVLLQIDQDTTLAHELNKASDEIRDSFSGDKIGATIRLNNTDDAIQVELVDRAKAPKAITILADLIDRGDLDSYNEGVFRDTGKIELRIPSAKFDKVVQDSLANAVRQIRDRVNKYGVTMPSVSLQKESASIRVQIPGEKDPTRVIADIIRPAQLEFYALHKDNDTLVGTLYERAEWDRYDKGKNPPYYILSKTDINRDKNIGWKLIEGKRVPAGYKAMAGRPLTKDEELKKEASADADLPLGQVYIVERTRKMGGDNLRDASMRNNMSDLSDPVKVSLTFNAVGARNFHKLSKDYLEERMAIALDGLIYSAPVFRQVIPNGRGEISGHFTPDQAHSLAMVLKSGTLKAELEPVEKRLIGPSLGEESIRESTYALIIGAIGVTCFMILYYGMAGVISILALALNVLVILGCLDMFNATLTLSGIGGMILTLGMAVDANVLIYERMREEIDAGRSIRDAIRLGFGQAFSVILDSNMTTLLAAFALLQFGEGTVQGFALTMAFGLLANLFTGLTVTYALCTLWFKLSGNLSLGFLHIFKKPNFDFISTRYITFTLSTLMVLSSIVFLGINRGPNMGIVFKGGVVSEIRIDDENDQSEKIKKSLQKAGLEDQSTVQWAPEDNLYIVRLALLVNPDADTPATESGAGDVHYTERCIQAALSEAFATKVKIEDVVDGATTTTLTTEAVDGATTGTQTAKTANIGTDKDLKITILSTMAVSQEVGQGFQEIAFMVIIAASCCILLYLWFRFELVFGMAAVLALVHDLTITLGVITLLGVQVNLDIVSALLILLGFSVNDTIVIFDRVRENSHSMYNSTFKEICNAAMNRSLSRTVITSLTTVGVMFIMYAFGGHSLAPFALTLIVGGIVGTYSSDFLAAPFVFWWNDRQKGRLVEHLGRKGAAEQPVDSAGKPLATAKAVSGGTGGAQSAPQRRRGRR